MRRVLLLLGLIAGMLFLTPTAALACSCVERSAASDVKRADSVFEGTLAWSSGTFSDASYGVRVDRVFKGKAAAFEKVRSKAQEADCPLGSPVAERRYLFFVRGEHPGQMQVEGCSGTEESTDALVADVTAVTGESSAPLPAATPTAEAGSSGLGFLGWTVVALGVALLVMLGATGLKRSF